MKTVTATVAASSTGLRLPAGGPARVSPLLPLRSSATQIRAPRISPSHGPEIRDRH